MDNSCIQSLKSLFKTLPVFKRIFLKSAGQFIFKELHNTELASSMLCFFVGFFFFQTWSGPQLYVENNVLTVMLVGTAVSLFPRRQDASSHTAKTLSYTLSSPQGSPHSCNTLFHWRGNKKFQGGIRIARDWSLKGCDIISQASHLNARIFYTMDTINYIQLFFSIC